MASLLINDGCWTWFNHPVAAPDGYGNLYVGSWQAAGLRPVVTKFDASGRSEVMSNYCVPLSSSYETDDHDNPAMLPLASGKILACWGYHNGDSFCATTTSAGDPTVWNAPVTVQTAAADSYAQIMQADDNNDTIYWFFRRGSSNPRPQYFRTSTDDGATWSAATEFLSVASQRPYFRWWKTSGTRFDFCVNNGQPNETVNSLYHGYIEIDPTDGSRTYHKSDGTLIGDDTDLPLAVTDLTLVYDGTTSESWIWDLKYIDGQPTCVFTVFPSHGTDSHEYHRGRFNGSTWATEKICDAGTTAAVDYLYAGGGETYSGGICLDPLDEDIVYASREYGSLNFRVETWTKSGSWSKTADLSGDTSNINARPVAVNNNGTTNILWWSGTYASYTSFDTDVYISPATSLRTAKVASPTLVTGYTPPYAKVYLPLGEASGAPVDLLGTYTPTQQGTVTRTADAFGYYASGFSTSNYFEMDAVGAAWSSGAYPKWMAVQISNTDTTLTQYPIAFGNSADNDSLMAILINLTTAGNISYQLRNDASTNITVTVTGTSINDGNKHVIFAVSRAANNHRLYLDGALIGSTTSSLGTITINRAAVGALRRASVTNPFLGKIYAAAAGWGGEPSFAYQNEDWSTGRFSGAAPAAATSGEQRGPVFSSVFSPVNPPLELLNALGLA